MSLPFSFGRPGLSDARCSLGMQVGSYGEATGMCGIVGVSGQSDPVVVGVMLKGISHRGPDSQGQASRSWGTLGHRRLAIVDPDGGQQPILNEDRSRVLVVNGEIYNHLSLRRALERRHRFRSRSDSEVILHLYEDQGPDCVRGLDGMFAAAISDGSAVFAARDALGIKPLYYTKRNERNGCIAFASEIKAWGRNSSRIQEFPPGHFFHSDLGFRRYYQLCTPEAVEAPTDESIRTLRNGLEAAVAKRLMSDVPVGTFLSGGLDSSAISALARQHLDELHSVSVGMKGCDDLEAARRVARHLDTVHHEYLYTAEEVIEELPRIIYHLESFDVDLVRSAIPCYFASRLASKHMKVVLTGEGADELFAGYEYHRRFDCGRMLHAELERSVAALHNMNLQRVDRMTMAHSIEGRVPFLDLAVVDIALSLPPQLKLHGDLPAEKWILRKACEDLLPDDIVWRKKAQFDTGTGTTALLEKRIHDVAAHHGLKRGESESPRRLEARLYRHLFRREFSAETDHLVARWRGGEAA